MERSSGLFDANFPLFQNSIYTCIGGIETFNKLRLLDVSFNCIASLAELTPLAHLHNLISVSTIVVECLESFVFVLLQKFP